MKIERTSNGVYIGGELGGITLQVFNPKFMFTPIEWTFEKEAGYLTTSFTILNCQIVLEALIDRASQEKWKARLEESQKEYENGDYYLFIHNKNRLLRELADYMEENPGLRFWQALFAWTGAKKIEVDGEDPFHWEEKIVNRN